MFLNPYLSIILQETMFATHKELWLNVQVAIVFGKGQIIFIDQT